MACWQQPGEAHWLFTGTSPLSFWRTHSLAPGWRLRQDFESELWGKNLFTCSSFMAFNHNHSVNRQVVRSDRQTIPSSHGLGQTGVQKKIITFCLPNGMRNCEKSNFSALIWKKGGNKGKNFWREEGQKKKGKRRREGHL